MIDDKSSLAAKARAADIATCAIDGFDRVTAESLSNCYFEDVPFEATRYLQRAVAAFAPAILDHARHLARRDIAETHRALVNEIAARKVSP